MFNEREVCYYAHIQWFPLPKWQDPLVSHLFHFISYQPTGSRGSYNVVHHIWKGPFIRPSKPVLLLIKSQSGQYFWAKIKRGNQSFWNQLRKGSNFQIRLCNHSPCLYIHGESHMMIYFCLSLTSTKLQTTLRFSPLIQCQGRFWA